MLFLLILVFLPCLYNYFVSQYISDFVCGTNHMEVNVKKDIIGQFNDKHCKALQGKPKVFIMPAMGGT